MVAWKTWRWSFYIQGACIIPCAIFFALCPRQYLDYEGTVKYRIRCAHIVQQRLYKSINEDNIKKEDKSLADRNMSVASLR